MARHADSSLTQPCERATDPIPTPLPYRLLLKLWLGAEQLLATCAESKDRLIDFEKDRGPPAPEPAPKPAPVGIVSRLFS